MLALVNSNPFCNYDAMIRTLYEVQQREDKTVEEYMLCIHDAVVVIRCAYLEHLLDRGRDLKKDRFYHGLHPYLHDALSFAMAELPKREQARPTFDTLYTLAKKVEVGQPVRTHRYTSSFKIYREKHRCYPVLVGQVAALEEGGWHQQILSLGRTLSLRWKRLMASTCAWRRR